MNRPRAYIIPKVENVTIERVALPSAWRDPQQTFYRNPRTHASTNGSGSVLRGFSCMYENMKLFLRDVCEQVFEAT